MSFHLSDIRHAPLKELMAETQRLRQERSRNRVELCAIVNIKNGRCPMNCRFCAQSAHYATETNVYPLLDRETLRRETETAWKQGVRRVGWVAGGRVVDEDDLEKIHAASVGLNGLGRRCASLGQLRKEAMRTLKEAGFTRYHHNLETSESFYPSICTTQRWRDRYDTVHRAKEAGLETCSGGLFGLGETWEDRHALAITLRDLEVDSVPINFFNPIRGTPLGCRKPMETDEALRIIALFRILLPKTSIRICGGRPTTLGCREAELFQAGADALMTGNYLTTTGRDIPHDREMIRNLGLILDEDGDDD